MDTVPYCGIKMYMNANISIVIFYFVCKSGADPGIKKKGGGGGGGGGGYGAEASQLKTHHIF